MKLPSSAISQASRRSPRLLILAATGLSFLHVASGALVFSENFGTFNSAWYTSGNIGSTAWQVARSGGDWGARIHDYDAVGPATGELTLSNDASSTATPNAEGWVFAHLNSGTAFSSPYTTTLASNPGLVTWTLNMRQIRPDPGGFASGNYAVAFVLGSTVGNVASSSNGYALVYGQSGTADPLRLVRFTGGLQGTLTNIITASSPLADLGAEYLSIQLTYDPSTSLWGLSGRNDGASAFANPASGTLFSLGSGTDLAYVNTALSQFGAYWQGATAANQTASFANISVSVIPELSAVWTGLALGLGLLHRRRERNPDSQPRHAKVNCRSLPSGCGRGHPRFGLCRIPFLR